MFELTNNMRRLAKEIFNSEQDEQKFFDALALGQSSEQAIVLIDSNINHFKLNPQQGLQADFIHWIEKGQMPGQHLDHDLGKYYCLDYSSVFEAAVFWGIKQKPEIVIDLCASPGGKTILAWKFFQPKTLIANEVIGKRLGQLHSNLKRCNIPAIITNNDSLDFAKNCELSADLVIVDAPCTGQSLIAKGKKSPSCFHPATINLNFNRQKRIIANAASCVRNNAYLAYMTCTYSFKENEGIVSWFLKKFPEFQAVSVDRLENFRSRLIVEPCYRLFPQEKLGAGGFCVLFKRSTEAENKTANLSKLKKIGQ